MKLYTYAPAVSLLIGLAASSSAQVTQVGSAYRFRANYTKGTVIKFMTVNGIENKGGSAPKESVNVPLSLSVLDKKNGIAKIKLTMGAIKVGNQVMQPENSTTFSLDDRNQTSGSDSQSVGTKFPAKTIYVGSTWQDVRPFNIGNTTAALHSTYRFAGTKKVNGKAVAVITYQLSGFAAGTGTMMVLVKDGTLYSNETRINMEGGGERSLIRVVSKMTRI